MPRGSAETVQILLVDDHPLFRQGLAQLINQESDLEICGEADTARQALTLAERLSPTLAIVDLTLEESSGLDLIRRLRSLHPELRILVVSMHDEMLCAERALRVGARGYVMKREAAECVLSAIRTILAGEVYLSERVRARLRPIGDSPGGGEGTSPTTVLSDREFEVFQMIGQGLTPRQVAQQLHLSVRTIEAHREHIKKKLGIRSAAELLKYAIHWNQEERG
ncbi:response regulator transcription factor [Candidatus Sumerlaeota bacterium]|nr:response regulator transcription factor [Candidatus Sumerlaeota bacterium]